MLEKMVITNFKCFRNRTEIDFTRTNYTSLPCNVADNNVLKGAVFVGANASGKSTIIEAVFSLLNYLFGENPIDFNFDVCLFSGVRKYELDYYFLIDGHHIRYDIAISAGEKRSITEELYLDQKLLLKRIGLGADSYIADPNGVSYDETDIDKETLFLRTLYFNTKFASNPVLKKWMEFLMHSVCMDAFTRSLYCFAKPAIILSSYLKDYGVEEINDFFASEGFDQRVEYAHDAVGKYTTVSLNGDSNEKSIFFRRDGIEEPIPYQLESSGTRNLLNMIPSFLYILKNDGMLLIDEFSSGFHNELESLLIRYFMSHSSHSQLFLVTHSTNLLSNGLLRPDQEYSVDFCGIEGSQVKRFSSEQPRLAQNIEKMYNSGVFGGLPHYTKE